jgi:DNA-binding IclR family transcriptional regulator
MRSSSKPIVALEQGLTVLASFTGQSHPLGVAELRARTGLPERAIRRAMSALKEMNYLHHHAASDRYALGAAAWSFACNRVTTFELRDFAGLLMDELVDSTPVSVALGVRLGCNMVCIEARRSRTVVALEMAVGTQLPLANTAMGRAYLAACAEGERAMLIESISAATRNRDQDIGLMIERAFASHELLGACYSFGEWQPDVNSIAVGFHPGHGLPTMAISCGAPAMHVSSEYLLNEVRPRLRHLVQRIQQEFGQCREAR